MPPPPLLLEFGPCDPCLAPPNLAIVACNARDCHSAASSSRAARLRRSKVDRRCNRAVQGQPKRRRVNRPSLQKRGSPPFAAPSAADRAGTCPGPRQQHRLAVAPRRGGATDRGGTRARCCPFVLPA